MLTRKYWSSQGTVIQIPDEASLDVAYKNRPANLNDLLLRTVDGYPEKEAFICDDMRLTYGQSMDRMLRIAAGLKHHNLEGGDRVALLLGNCLEFALCFFAVSMVGGVSVILNTRLESQELDYIINDAGPTILIAHQDFWERIEPIRDRLTTVKHMFVVTDEAAPQGAIPYKALLNEGRVGKPLDPDENDLCCLMYTSGTTGLPKGAMITHRNIVINSVNCQRVEDFQPEDINLIIVPLFHATGLFGQLVLSVYGGGTSVIMREYKTNKALELIEKEAATFTATVPTVLWMMMNWPDFQKYDLGHFRKIMYGGSPSTEVLIRALNKNFPNAKLCEGFGMTEATVVVTLLPPEDTLRKLGSVGLPVPFMDVKVIDGDGTALAAGEVGELCIKGPTICAGYWNKEEATKEAFRDGWLHTGDLAGIDEEGFIYIKGRKKEMIIRGGENVYCVEVEDVLYSHPKVLEAALVGVPDDVFGEEGKAVVVLRPGEEASAEDIQEHCRERLARYKVPKYVVFLDDLPKNPSGKVLKNKLRDME